MLGGVRSKRDLTCTRAIRSAVPVLILRIGQSVGFDVAGTVSKGAAGDLPVAFAEEGAGAGCADGGLAQDAGQVGIAVAGGAPIFLLRGGFLHPGSELRPGGQVARVGKRVMSRPTSAPRSGRANAPP